MRGKWKIVIEAWPCETDEGLEADMKAAAAEDGAHFFYVDAAHVDDAVRMARCFAEGMERNPRVLRAVITGVYCMKPPIASMPRTLGEEKANGD